MGKHLLNKQQKVLLEELISSTSLEQRIWISGYVNGLLSDNKSLKTGVAELPQVTILYGTQTGNSKKVAQQAAQSLEAKGIIPKIVSMDKYKPTQLKKEQILLVVVSTHGDGNPPTQALNFYDFVRGRRAPKSPDLKFAVVGLGDKSYTNFCQTGVDIFHALEALEAKPLIPLQKCDVDYRAEVSQWTESVTEYIVSLSGERTASVEAVSTDLGDENEPYSLFNPFYAEMLLRQRITDSRSEKEVIHYELSLEGSGLQYTPGDALGILANNPPDLTDKILHFLNVKPSENVALPGTGEECAAHEALCNHYEITVLSRSLLESYQALSNNAPLAELLKSKKKTEEYLEGNDVLDLLQDYPAKIFFVELLSILRLLPPRFYSIASSLEANPDEVHLTIAKVEYEHRERQRKGSCSTFLSDRVSEGDTIPVFIQHNENFSLPDNEETPTIMIGAGAGVAPYRAFLQERESRQSTGQNWLFFGGRHFKLDFLYQKEWQDYLKENILHRIDVAFSRDTDKKIYIQDKLLAHASEVYQWIENKAILYVCGNRSAMGAGVEKTLKQIICEQGRKSADEADEFYQQLQIEKRLQVDIY